MKEMQPVRGKSEARQQQLHLFLLHSLTHPLRDIAPTNPISLHEAKKHERPEQASRPIKIWSSLAHSPRIKCCNSDNDNGNGNGNHNVLVLARPDAAHLSCAGLGQELVQVESVRRLARLLRPHWVAAILA